MINKLMLLSGVDIPFISAQLLIHQPTIKEISMIGENVFYTGCGILNFSKDSLSPEDRSHLEKLSDFEVLMSLLTGNNVELQQNRINAMMVLSLLFPEYEIKFSIKEIRLQKEDEIRSINSDNFKSFKEILSAMFCLGGRGDDAQDYNPGGQKAREIAEKLKKRKQILAEQSGATELSVLGRFASILATGQCCDLNTILNYTVYQLFEQYDRFELKEAYDMHFKAQLAGARDLEEVENWRKDLHDQSKK
jgi:hypothetical protein